MEVELFVHGVPNGEGFWGKDEDRNYFGTFYDHSSDEVKFLIQTRAFKGKQYCYYNYLVYKTIEATSPNIVAYDGRDGSYFGITLRLDAYCKDIINMYRILDTVYNVYIIGSLLKMDKMKLKYTTPDFTSVSNVLENVEKVVIQLIQNAFSNESFTRLDGFSMNAGNYPSYNLYDCTPENVLSAIKQFNRVAISPYYLSNKENAIRQQCNTQIQSIQQQCNAQMKAEVDAHSKEKNGLISSLEVEKNKVNQLQKDIKEKEGTIYQLNNERYRLQSELRSAGQSRKVAQIVSSIKEPLIDLTFLLKSIFPEERKGYDSPHTNIFVTFIKKIGLCVPYFNLLLMLAIVGILMASYGKNPIWGNNNKISENIESLRQDISALQEHLGYTSKDNSVELQNITTPSFNIESVDINIKDFGGQDLSLNKVYTVEALNGAENGTWKVEGCKLESTQNPNIIKIIPNANVVKIIYCVGEQTKLRELKAK